MVVYWTVVAIGYQGVEEKNIKFTSGGLGEIFIGIAVF
jgi:hypothetical protein